MQPPFPAPVWPAFNYAPTPIACWKKATPTAAANARLMGGDGHSNGFHDDRSSTTRDARMSAIICEYVHETLEPPPLRSAFFGLKHTHLFHSRAVAVRHLHKYRTRLAYANTCSTSEQKKPQCSMQYGDILVLPLDISHRGDSGRTTRLSSIRTGGMPPTVQRYCMS